MKPARMTAPNAKRNAPRPGNVGGGSGISVASPTTTSSTVGSDTVPESGVVVKSPGSESESGTGRAYPRGSQHHEGAGSTATNPVASAPVRTLIVLPTYNEAENIVAMLTRVRRAVPHADILVVDDGSPDGTADRADATAADLGHITVIRRNEKSGLGSAYRAGFRWGLARDYDAFVEMDCDFSHDPDALPSLLAPVEAGAALVIGSRYVAGGRIPDWSPSRRAISWAGNTYARAMLRLSVRDATAGFRAYARDALESIDLDSVAADGYGFQVEMAYLVDQSGAAIVEVPITFRDRRLGTSKMSGRIVAEALLLVTWWGLRVRAQHLWQLVPRAWPRRHKPSS